MDTVKAQELIENLLERLLPVAGRYELPGGVLSGKERAALALLAGAHEAVADGETPEQQPPAAPAILPKRVRLSDECLGAPRDESGLLCIDFGTAFSKAAIWLDGDDAPEPIDLGVVAGGRDLFVESAAFIDDGHVFFGPEAVRRHGEEGDASRSLFSSPKEHLTHDHARFHADRPTVEVDPTRRFRTRDLLALYLGYLTSLVGERTQTLGLGRHVVRRFAAPGWGDAQISQSTPHFEAVAAQLKHLLIDAQILADTIPAAAWREGVDVGVARAALDELGHVSNEKREAAVFIERSVLEAVAAATGIQDRLVNQRPQVLVVDVGAGTTDIGAFKYNVNLDAASVHAYRGGLRAIRMAGNRLDDALIELAWSKLELASDSQLHPMHQRKMRLAVRDHKRDLFANGAVRIDVDGFDPVSVEADDFVSTRPVGLFARSFEEGVKAALNGAGAGGRNFRQTREPNVAVFTGGGGALPFLRDIVRRPIELEDGPVHFEVRDPTPAWLDQYDVSIATVFPQLAVATGGCAPYLPDAKNSVVDTSTAPARSLTPGYKS